MQDIRRQLEALGRRGRLLLVLQRLLQWASAVIVAAYLLAVVDYALRLPGPARLVLGATVAATAGVWVARRTWRALAFRPSVAELALRAERVYPHLRGLLTSAVELAAAGASHRPLEDGPHARVLADASVDRARAAVGSVDLNRVIDPTRTLRRLAVFALCLSVLAATVVLAPAASATAAARWLDPLGDAEWPRRVDARLAALPEVLPVDAAIPLRATVERGDRPGLSVRLAYRFVAPGEPPGPWQYALMSRQAGAAAVDGAGGTGYGVYEAVVDPPPTLVRKLNAGDVDAAEVQFRVTAGDHETPRQAARLAARPAVRRVAAVVTPPPYAAGLLDPRGIELAAEDASPGSVSALSAQAGSSVELTVDFNKPVDADALASLGEHVPGLAGAPGFEASLGPRDRGVGAPRAASTLTARFELREDLQTALRAVDRGGLALTDDRVYRFDAAPDALPSAAIVEPASDLSVLPSAVVPLSAVGRDDLGLVSLELRSQRVTPDAGAAAAAADGEGTSDDAEPAGPEPPRVLARQTGRRTAFEISHTLELAALGVAVGDEVVLTAVAQDVFELDGERHEPAVSTPRRLRVIDEAGLMDRVRSDLAALRQRAVRMEQTQRRLEAAPAELAGPRQAELTRGLEAAAERVDELEARLDLNRVDAPAVRELIDAARGLLDSAAASSRDAAETLADPESTAEQQAAAREQQERARRDLGELVEMLDQGADALSLRLDLDRLRTQQDAVAQETRRLLPRTVGKTAEELGPELRDALEALREQQAALAEQARDVTRRLRSTAAALSRQSETDRDQATAEALAEAAAVAQRQGLDEAMEEAEEAIEENRLSSAGGNQQQALDVLEEMLRQVGSQQMRMREMLRRRLTELAQRLERLIERQEGELDRLADAAVAAGADVWPVLASDQAKLRQATVAAEVEAAKSDETAPAAASIADAVAAQARAVLALRESDSAAADPAERSALASLNAALEAIREARDDQAQDDTQRRRDELRRAYTALADRQDAVRDAVAPLAEAARLTRRQRASLIEQGAEQEAVRQEAGALGEEAGETLVFKSMHERIDADAAMAGRLLRRGVADAEAVGAQRRVARTLRRMAEALDLEPPPEDFEGRQESGGGGGGEGEPPPLVPPLAELKLLRALQSDILDETVEASAAEAVRPLGAEALRRRLSALSARQQELAELGERLIEQLQPSQPGVPQMVPPVSPGGDDGDGEGDGGASVVRPGETGGRGGR